MCKLNYVLKCLLNNQQFKFHKFLKIQKKEHKHVGIHTLQPLSTHYGTHVNGCMHAYTYRLSLSLAQTCMQTQSHTRDKWVLILKK